jgi:hypothetical protein
LSQDDDLEHVIRDDNWKAVWSKTGTLGKQILLEHLSNVLNNRQNHPGCPTFSENDKIKAERTLNDLLVMTEDEESEQQVSELRASMIHQIMISTALTIYKSPTRNIMVIALKSIYGRMDNEAWAQLCGQWKNAAGQARLAVFWAARVLQIIHSHRCTHFATPVSLFHAVLVLWLYSIVAERQLGDFTQPYPAQSVVLGNKSLQSMDSLDWVETGWSSVKLPGTGNLLCLEGRRKLLEKSVVLMRSLRYWTISTSYSQLLDRLRAIEDPPTSDDTINVASQ